jgi:preprotein translocase subunit SecG
MSTLRLILTIIQVILALGLTVIVMFQSGKSAGLSAAIAGGSGDSFLSKNKKKGLDATLARMTKWIGAAFLVLTFALTLI